jgi:8-oxo-dGTP pyrophosphatase MutT (NUDIX family)
MDDFNSIYEKIQYALNDLPGGLAHKEMFPTRKTASELNLGPADYRESAVLALLYETSKSIKLVLTQRQDYQGKHGGQISFPGGKKEAGDIDLNQTALRETEEEIGLSSKNIHIIGKLTEVYIPVSNFLVQPFLARHQGEPQFFLQEREVKELITIDLISLKDDDIIQSKNIKTAEGYTLKNIPCFVFEGKVVWGATALILNELKYILKRID